MPGGLRTVVRVGEKDIVDCNWLSFECVDCKSQSRMVAWSWLEIAFDRLVA